jgi:hypothetical protein
MAKYAAKAVDHSILEMALVGYQAERARIRAAIQEIEAQLGQRGPGRPKRSGAAAAQPAVEPAPAASKRRKGLSVAARKRLSIAAKKRWAQRKAAGG